MNELILKYWNENNDKLKEYFKNNDQREYYNYKSLLVITLKTIFQDCDEDDEDLPDFDNITEIDHGSYDGTKIFIICNKTNYSPNIFNYWITFVQYGSCGYCDTLQSIIDESWDYDSEKHYPTDSQINGYWTLCLHMIQKMKKIYEVGSFSNNNLNEEGE